MGDRNGKFAPRATSILTTIILSILILSSMSPLFVIAGSTTTTLTGGKAEDTVQFPAGGGNGSVSLTLPYGANMTKASIGLEGLPVISTASFNHSKSYDFGPGIFEHVMPSGDHLTLATRDGWWNLSFYYRFEVVFNASDKARNNIVVSLQVNMTKMLNDYGVTKDFDRQSIRVIEHKKDGSLIVYNSSLFTDEAYLVPEKIIVPRDYDQSSNANITIDWNVSGLSPVNKVRYYSIYFDTLDHWKTPTNVPLKYYDDVIVSNDAQPNSYVSVFLSNGSGPHILADFKLPILGKYAGKPAIADINRDGYLDIVIPNLGGATGAQANSSIFLGGPTGFKNKPDINVTTVGAKAAAAADLNKDGWQDLVFACYSNNSVYRNDSQLFFGGAGGFKKVPDVKFNTTGASDVGVLDMNADGRPDLAFSSYYDGTKYNINSTLFIQNKTTGFKHEPDYKYPTTGAVDVATGDLNDDGIDDLVFANHFNNTGGLYANSVAYYGSKTTITGPGLIRGNATMGIDIVDVNKDAINDIVLANNGASGVVYSYIYYHNISGGYQVPTLKLKTDYASEVAHGDVNGDGSTDLGFASQFLPNSNGRVYIWCCSGFIEPSTKSLPNENAIAIKMADVDRYHMDLDMDPPLLTVKGIEDKYYATGNYTSKAVYPGDRVLSAVARWTSLQPVGSTVHVFLSNDDGSTWFETKNTVGIDFQTNGSSLMYKVELGTVTVTPRFDWINITYGLGGYPTDVEVDIGDDGVVDWFHPGTFNNTTVWNTTALGTELDLHTRPARFYPWENITVPIRVFSSTSGILRIYNINLTHNSPPYLTKPLPDVSFDQDGHALAAFRLDDYFSDMDKGNLTYTVQGNTSVYVRIGNTNIVDLSARAGWNGVEHLMFMAHDADGGIAMAQVTVTVRPVNKAPKAVIHRSPSTNVNSFMNVTFDGSNSTDADGKIVQYIWGFDDGSFGMGPIVSHAFARPNKGYNVVLTVVDNGGLSGTAQVSVPVGNLAPIAKLRIVDDTSNGFDTNANIVIDTSGTMDRDGSIVSYALDFGDGSVLTPPSGQGVPPASWEHQYKNGTKTYTLTLLVRDDGGQIATATAKVLINNVPPQIVVVTAPSKAYIGQKVNFGVQARDPDGKITKYMWDFEGVGEYTWTSDLNGNGTHTYKKAGTYQAHLKVIDDSGKSSYYTVSVKVEEQPADTGLGLALVLGIVLLAFLGVLGYYIFHQRSIILRQKDLLVKRDETLRALQKELTDETAETERKAAATKRASASEEEAKDEEEDLGTLEPLEATGPREASKPIPTAPSTIPSTQVGPIIAATQKTIFEPVESTGIMQKEQPKPPAQPPVAPKEQTKPQVQIPIVPKGLPDMMGAAQSAAPPAPPKPAPKEEEEIDEETGPEEIEEAPDKPVETGKVLAKARCPACKSLIPLYSLEKPMRIKCENCGKEGVIK